MTVTRKGNYPCRHDDVIKLKHFPRYWPFVRGIHWSPVNSPHKGQWRGALIFSLICTRINGWVNNGEAGDLRHNRAHYDVTVMKQIKTPQHGNAFRITGPCFEGISPVNKPQRACKIVLWFFHYHYSSSIDCATLTLDQNDTLTYISGKITLLVLDAKIHFDNHSTVSCPIS